jgi:hypothetical protein
MGWKDLSFEFKVGIILLGVVVLLLAITTQNITVPRPSLTDLFYLLAFILVLEWLSLPFMVSRLNKKMEQSIKLQTAANETSEKLLQSMNELKSVIRGVGEISRNHPDES